MEIELQKNKYSASEMALLGIFVLGLVLSFLLVANRNKIPHSQPLTAQFDGLKISVPSGRGWLANEKWIYSGINNTLNLQTVLKQDAEDPRSENVARIVWQYHIAPSPFSVDETIRLQRLKNRIAKVRTEVTTAGGLDFTTMIFTTFTSDPQFSFEDFYYAVCELETGRQLTLEVRTQADSELAQRAFTSAMRGLAYSPDPRYQAGSKFITDLKNTGINELLKAETGDNFRRVYLLENSQPNSNSRNIAMSNYSGFTVERFSLVKDLNGRPGINSVGRNYIEGANGYQATTLFDSDKSLDFFIWKTERSLLNNRIGSEIHIEYFDGVMRYDDSAMRYKDPEFSPSAAALPDIFFDTAATAFLESGQEGILIDLIFSDGRIVPAEMTKRSPGLDHTGSDVDRVIRCSLFNAEDSYYEVHFDKNGNIIGKTEKTDRLYKLKKTDIKTLIENFPQWKNEIQQMLKKI